MGGRGGGGGDPAHETLAIIAVVTCPSPGRNQYVAIDSVLLLGLFRLSTSSPQCCFDPILVYYVRRLAVILSLLYLLFVLFFGIFLAYFFCKFSLAFPCTIDKTYDNNLYTKNCRPNEPPLYYWEFACPRGFCISMRLFLLFSHSSSSTQQTLLEPLLLILLIAYDTTAAPHQ